MQFAPIPENDFAEFIRIYYHECRGRFPAIEAIGGKWMFRDLLPGMSDFDTRFICRDGMTADDWCAMSAAVGDAHLRMCREYACWMRNLEHLPGINLTWSELTAEPLYYPECRQWTFYDTECPEALHRALTALRARPWDVKDEYFFLKKFCLYYGRYDRQIDPPVNMFPHEARYPMHSRVMHYFVPPLQSAMCLLERRHVAGKFEALERAETRFPGLACWEVIRELLHAHYEALRWYEEPRLSQFEVMLEKALSEVARALREVLTIVPAEAGVNIPQWKAALARFPIDPAFYVFDNMRFSRLMKGRLEFYADAPDYFDAAWLIANELKRIGNAFFTQPFRVFWKLYAGEEVAEPLDILEKLRGDVLSAEEIADTREFARLAFLPWVPGEERRRAREIAAVYDGFYHALYKISAVLMRETALSPGDT